MTTLTSPWNGIDVQAPHRSRAVIAFLWVLQIASAAMFLFAGSLKLTGAPLMVHEFGVIGLGQWFRTFTGTIEVVSAILLLIPSVALYGATALAVTMVGAIVTHLFIIGGNPVAAIILLASTTTIAWLRWRDR